MKSKNQEQIIPKPAYPGENEFSAWRRSYYSHHKKPMTYQNKMFDKACAKAYLMYLKETGAIPEPVDWRNLSFEDLMARTKNLDER